MSNRRITESVVEEAALSWFEELGYAVVRGPDIAPGELFSEGEETWFRHAPFQRCLSRLSENIRTAP